MLPTLGGEWVVLRGYSYRQNWRFDGVTIWTRSKGFDIVKEGPNKTPIVEAIAKFWCR